MDRFKQWRGTGLLLIVVAALSFAAARVTQTVPSAVWADSTRPPYSTALSPETSGPALGTGTGQSPPVAPQANAMGAKSTTPVQEIDPSMSMPLAGVLSNPGNGPVLPLSQGQLRAGGLTVSAVGSVIRPADEAYIIVIPELYYGPSGPEPLSSEDKQDVLENLAELGIEESAVEFTRTGRYDPSTISVEIDMEELPAKAKDVVEAVEEVVRQMETYGVRYVLSPEHCQQALALARRQAIPSARQAADDLAEALGAGLGSVIGVLEYPVSNAFSLTRSHADDCGDQSFDAHYSEVGDMVSLDSEPKVTVSVGLQVTYSLQ